MFDNIIFRAKGGELFDRIVEQGHFTEDETRIVILQLLLGLNYLHEQGIVHRDIKPENILLSGYEGLDVKLADFGLAKIVGEQSFMKTLCGTPMYVAPEVLKSRSGRVYSNKVDIWSLGVVLYICIFGFPPFSGIGIAN
ncbi:putative myosin light chain kinase [Smittium culicis]|uniref:Putative myosin light chain kinase n=1 Tax=Smittium culicis TaxID=133412 RepID=A0A1R1YPW6_9FUNG|nr:putative myosin light chain kinase [Smittium culicis]